MLYLHILHIHLIEDMFCAFSETEIYKISETEIYKKLSPA